MHKKTEGAEKKSIGTKTLLLISDSLKTDHCDVSNVAIAVGGVLIDSDRTQNHSAAVASAVAADRCFVSALVCRLRTAIAGGEAGSIRRNVCVDGCQNLQKMAKSIF